MEENRPNSWSSFVKDTYFADGDISTSQINSFCKEQSDSIKFISFDNKLLNGLEKHFPVLNIQSSTKENFYKIERLALTTELYNEIEKLCTVTHPMLQNLQTEISLITCFGYLPRSKKPIFHDMGTIPKIEGELSKLKRFLSERVEHDTGIINPEESATETVKDYYPKYLIDRVIVNLKDDDSKIKPIKIYDKNYPINDKVKLGLLFAEAFDTVLEKLKVADNYVKQNTNECFIKQFKAYLNYEKILFPSQNEFLRVFLILYELTGHTLQGYKEDRTEADKISSIKHWLK